jgi:predicted dehydrogenase
MSDKPTRRDFIKNTAVAAAGVMAAGHSSRAIGANQRIRAGFIGVGNRGGQLLDAALPNEDLEVVALCDVYKPYLDKWAIKVGGDVATYGDFRRVIERDDIDVVFIGTPDHWHAIQTISACDAGKDVYVEKPMSYTVFEGRRMVEAARRNKRIVQVGTQRRSSALYHKLADYIQNDGIGKVSVARCCRLSNMWPKGMGKAPDSDPPADLDWDMWIGPRPFRPYNENIAPYKFRWCSDYSSQIGNWGVHYFDLIRWMLNEVGPVSISAHGGRYAVDDDRTIPDTLEAVYELESGRLVVFSQYEANGHPMFKFGDIELRGTRGTVYASSRKYEVIPDSGGQFQDKEPRMEPVEEKLDSGDDTANHIRNFLDCVKSRETPNADVEEGHRSTTFAHLGNIALATRSRIDWDPKAERIPGNEKANAMLHYDYREPWVLG